jgi:hypothetical protein
MPALVICPASLQIKKLAGDSQLTREEVLGFLKWWASLSPEARKDMQATREAAEAAEEQRKQVREQQKRAAHDEAVLKNKSYQGKFKRTPCRIAHDECWLVSDLCLWTEKPVMTSSAEAMHGMTQHAA